MSLMHARRHAACLIFLLGGVGCHRDSIRLPEVVAATETGPRVTHVEGRPRDLGFVSAPAVGPKAEANAGPAEVPERPLASSADTPADQPPLVLPQVEQTLPPNGVATKPQGPTGGNPGFVSRNSGTPRLDAAIARAEAREPADPTPPATPPQTPETTQGDVVASNSPIVQLPETTQPSLAPPAELPLEFHAPDLPPATPESSENTPPAKSVETPREETSAKLEPVAPPSVPPTPEELWRDTLERLRDLAHRRAGEPGSEADAWVLKARLLDWLEAGGPAPDQLDVWTHLVEALSPDPTKPEGGDEELADRLRKTVELLEANGPLRVSALQLCAKVSGFGDITPIEPSALRAGRPVLVYCELTGLRYEPHEGGARSRLLSRLELIPAGSGASVCTLEPGPVEDHCRQRRRDCYVNYRFLIPSEVQPGSYALRVTQTDLIGQVSATASIPVELER